MSRDIIPVANPHAQYRAHANELQAAIIAVLEKGHYVLGQEVSAFEVEFAGFIGAREAVGVGNGTDALALALRAVGVKEGGEVVTVSHSAVATAAAIRQVGATPVFVDIDAERCCMDPALIRAVCTSSTQAIVPVHIYGQPADMGAILAVAESLKLPVVEDCAQAHGASISGKRVGTFGAAAAFSFYPTKNLGAIGDGGAVVSNFPEITEKVRLLRQYGWRERYVSETEGFNSRLDELQAAILRIKLRYLEQGNARRREIAAAYSSAASSGRLKVPAKIADTIHAMHLYVVESSEREEFERYLESRGICCARHYPRAIHQQPAYANCHRGNLARTEHLYQQIVTLPLYPELADSEVERVCTALAEWTI